MPDGGLEQNTSACFLLAFHFHLERLSRQSEGVRTFFDRFLPSKMCDQIAAIAVDKMNLTLADRKEHSASIIKPPVLYDISTMPVEMARAREWFAQEHGGYTRFVEEMWEFLKKKFDRDCAIFCHIMYGWGKDGGWVHLGVWPMEESADPQALIVPIECLTEEEKRAAGYDATSRGSG